MRSNEIKIGDKFEKLTVVELPDKRNKEGKLLVVCKCDCGNIVEVVKYKLVQQYKPIRSCGCLRLERVHQNKTRHGESGGAIVGNRSKLYRTWSNMKSRCYNPNVRSYADYGAKGITVCDEWLNSYETFRDWALSNGYQEDLTIDRINPHGDYCPENCRWLTLHDNSSMAHEKACWGRNLKTGEYVEFVNIRNFAKDRNLSYSCIDRVLHGRNKTHKDWIFGYQEN